MYVCRYSLKILSFRSLKFYLEAVHLWIKMWDIYIVVDLGLVSFLAILVISYWAYTWQNPKCNGKLPPGSMGLPLLRETMDFFTPYSSNDIPSFINKRIASYIYIYIYIYMYTHTYKLIL